MEEKKSIKIGLSTFFLILAIIVIIVMVSYIYIDKTKSNKEIVNLEESTANMQSAINSLQEKMENVVQNIEENDNEPSFTDEQVRKTLSDFLELRAHANCDSLLENLTEKGKLNYEPSKDKYLEDGTIITTIKFSEYKEAMLNYVSEFEFEKNWNTTLYFNKSDDGYLIKTQGGGGLNVYTIIDIIKNDDINYIANTSYVTEDGTKSIENFSFTVKSYNGNCVIDSINN